MLSASTKEAANITKDLAANDIKNTAQNLKHDAQAAAGAAVHDISDYANQAGKKVRNFFSSADSELHEVSERVTSEIRNNPIRSSLIGVGVGYLLAVLFRR